MKINVNNTNNNTREHEPSYKMAQAVPKKEEGINYVYLEVTHQPNQKTPRPRHRSRAPRVTVPPNPTAEQIFSAAWAFCNPNGTTSHPSTPRHSLRASSHSTFSQPPPYTSRQDSQFSLDSHLPSYDSVMEVTDSNEVQNESAEVRIQKVLDKLCNERKLTKKQLERLLKNMGFEEHLISDAISSRNLL